MFVEILAELFSFRMFFLIIAGLTIGNIVGALPGLTATMTLAVLMPFTYFMPISYGLILLGSIYIGSMRGGGITAILINVPGTPADIATTFDGYPLAKQGKAREALMMSIFGSVMGGLIGTVLLLVACIPLARIALRFGPPEMFWLSILGISIIVSLSQGSLLKGMISGLFGLMLTTIGVSTVGGETRFTFGIPQLAGGIHMIAGMIGLYCIPRIIELAQEIRDDKQEVLEVKGSVHNVMWRMIKEWFSNFAGLISAIIGSIIGALPGAGSNIAGLVAYDWVKRLSKNSDNFGKGDIRGVTASETANNAVCSTSLIPTLAFGIPGSPPAALMLGALLVHGLLPGNRLFTEYAFETYTFMGGLFLANILLLPVGMYTSNLMSRVMYLPREVMAVIIGVLAVVGTISIRGNMMDVYSMGIIGIIMYFGGKAGFSPAPAVLGLVLGTLAEQGLTQSMMLASARGGMFHYFIGRPITVVLIILTAFCLVFPFIQSKFKKRTINNEAE